MNNNMNTSGKKQKKEAKRKMGDITMQFAFPF